MTRLNFLALALPLAMSSAAFAADSGNGAVYTHQAAAGAWEVTPGFTFGSIKSTLNSGNGLAQGGADMSSATDSIFDFNVSGEYGINDMFAVGLMLGYGSDSFSYSPSTSDVKASGMTDPAIYLKAKNDIGTGWLKWGAALSFAVAKHTISSDTTSLNEASGGITFTPYVGWEMADVGPGTFGARLSYDLIQTKRDITDNSSNTSPTLADGNKLSLVAYYEMHFDPVIWGWDLGFTNHAATKFNNGNGGADVDGNNGFNSVQIETYADWTVAPSVDILPTIGYGALNSSYLYGVQDVKSSMGIYGTLAARFTF